MKVMLGKILIEEDKTYFVSENGVQIPVTLKEKTRQWLEEKDPNAICIYKDNEGKSKDYFDLVGSHNKIEELVYHLDFDKENQKAQLVTYSSPSFDLGSIREHIEKSPYNKVYVGLYYCPDGKRFKLKGTSFMISRKKGDEYLSAEEYQAKIEKEIGRKLMKLQDAGIDIEDFKIVYSNVRYMKYNSQTFSRLQNDNHRLFETFKRQEEHGDFSLGFVAYGVDKNGGLWAENNPVTTTGSRGSNPFYLVGSFPSKEEYQQYGFEQIENALGTYKEKKQVIPQEEEETCMSPF